MRNEIIRFYYYLRRKILEILLILITILAVLPLLFHNEIVNRSFISVTVIFIGIFFILSNKLKSLYYISFTIRNHDKGWYGKYKENFLFDDSKRSFSIKGNRAIGIDAFDKESVIIFSNCLNWSNYIFSFEFKIIKECIGAVVRATNPSNFIMMQINKTYIKPHIKINEYWAIFDPNKEGLVFSNEISYDEWYKCELNCDRNKINIKITKSQKTEFDRQWNIPDRIFKIRHPEKKEYVELPPYIPLNIHNGTIGFRNSFKEEALVRNVLVKEI